jgi:mono/diheme cytochrome c family protein
MGGFLGPDLTNAAQRVPPARFTQLLDRGAGTMPAFHLSANESQAVAAYLAAVDATGQGTPPAPSGEPGPLFAAAFARYHSPNKPPPSSVARGASIVAARQCSACHLSFGVNPATHAPDLSFAIPFLGVSGVRAVLEGGRGAMSAQHLTPNETDDVVALLRWIAEHRDDLAPHVQPKIDAPWLAYPARPTSAHIAAAPSSPAPAFP